VSSERYSRNEALFGAEGQCKIADTSVALAGVGGLGSHVAQQLAHLGVRRIALIDPDVVTESSLNRLIGAVETDIIAATTKVAVAERMITAIDSAATVHMLPTTIDSKAATEAIAAADIVFGCLDSDLARLKLTELCAYHARPLFDLASDTGGEGDDRWYGGRVFFAAGTGCLVCQQVLDQRAIALESMDPSQRAIQEQIYGVAVGALAGTGPMVVSINGSVASMGVTEFMAHVTELRPAQTHLTLIYQHGVPVIRRVQDPPQPGCYFCTGLWNASGR
jgi:hypothetical protein